ncbi:MAG: phosphatidylserine decarboxylase [Bacteroidales bacterium]|nr:archaetidylserine decarboxylase [Bacteroidales bacterium]MCK9498616.1 archaetidylserine decarboxylase [Bacteroidales bacterium]MDY0313638.1 archaetidylserine decarboxylase [Bacteroidales bacterium]NLB86236.1 phosphatidylserine decarboxylase [Bacteroidales bacterium]
MKKPKFLVKAIISVYKRRYKIDLNDFVLPKNGFVSFNSFFTRKFKEKARPIGEGIISPIDGFLFDFGKILPENKIYVKYKNYYIDDLIIDYDENLNSYVVFYLSPADYHRVHASFDMKINSALYLPGTLRPVREKTVNKRNRVYCRNERIVLSGDSEYGKFYCVLVGALLVGKVKLSFDSGLQTNIKRGVMAEKKYEKEIIIKKGEEIGFFEMGSSVIVLLESEIFTKMEIDLNSPLKVGQELFKTHHFDL